MVDDQAKMQLMDPWATPYPLARVQIERLKSCKVTERDGCCISANWQLWCQAQEGKLWWRIRLTSTELNRLHDNGRPPGLQAENNFTAAKRVDSYAR